MGDQPGHLQRRLERDRVGDEAHHVVERAAARRRSHALARGRRPGRRPTSPASADRPGVRRRGSRRLRPAPERRRKTSSLPARSAIPSIGCSSSILRLLDRDDAVDLGQLREFSGADVDHHPRGDVVGDQRQAGDRGGDRFEVAEDAGEGGLVVVGRDDQRAVGAGLGGGLGQLDRVAGVVGAGAADHRRLVADLVDYRRQQRDVLLVVEGRRLAGRAGDDDAVRAVLDQVGGELPRRRLVDRPARLEGGRHRRQDSADLAHRWQGTGAVIRQRWAPCGRPRGPPARAGRRPAAARPRGPAGRRAGRRSAGRPRSTCSGSEIAGWPVALKAAVKQPPRKARSKAAIGSGPESSKVPERRRRLAHGRRQQQVEAGLVDAGEHPRSSPGAGRPPPGTRRRCALRPISASAQVSGSTSSGPIGCAADDAELVERLRLAGGPADEEGLDDRRCSAKRAHVRLLDLCARAPSSAFAAGPRRRDDLGVGVLLDHRSRSRGRSAACRVGAELLGVGARRAAGRRRDRRAPGRGPPRAAPRCRGPSARRRARAVRPDMMSPISGPSLIRCRLGLRPTRPQLEAGMRIEPPPSLAWAIGTMPAATAAPEPPLEPPVERSRSQGLRVGAVGARLGGRQDAQLGRVRLADRDQAGGAEALRQVGVDRGAEVALLQVAHAEVQRLAGECGAEVLEQEGDALEGPVGKLAREPPPALPRRAGGSRRSPRRWSPRCERSPLRPARPGSPPRSLTSSACAVASRRASSSLMA